MCGTKNEEKREHLVEKLRGLRNMMLRKFDLSLKKSAFDQIFIFFSKTLT